MVYYVFSSFIKGMDAILSLVAAILIESKRYCIGLMQAVMCMMKTTFTDTAYCVVYKYLHVSIVL